MTCSQQSRAIAALWAKHGLTIVLALVGLACYAAGLTLHLYNLSWLRTSDFLYNIGHGFFPLAVFNALAGRLREVNKPEE